MSEGTNEYLDQQLELRDKKEKVENKLKTVLKRLDKKIIPPGHEAEGHPLQDAAINLYTEKHQLEMQLKNNIRKKLGIAEEE